MKLLLFSCLITLALGRCTEQKVLTAADTTLADTLTIRNGTSFGMCAGYCKSDYVFNGTSVTLTQNGTRTAAQSPAKTCQTTISPADWNALKTLADVDAFSGKSATLGCPDCADGGAEYIELQTGDRKHRVTFEYNKTIPGFEPLVDAVRKQREAFKECK